MALNQGTENTVQAASQNGTEASDGTGEFPLSKLGGHFLTFTLRCRPA